ncbi:hydrogen peroxide-inducible genes activator [Plebeiibacterium sediminum]|uniref:LysR substrate-binding domain-containing protein n=1 Tax=Plebeiibacterium sediminum TaxID=2992112 RepID=A0AAE3M5Q6_9BACT|nr:hydrogen peroxide-inducible genes activator [Plebeiobacterium sediminum]MCW3787751.1 LysR substrate-binding domain-containing protein [Plebeiobacterium sediminum]
MTIQQLEYIVALNKYRHFVTASKECGVTQPTLSMMIQKLENELDVSIFDRSKHPVEPTEVGLRIINQAEATLRELKKVKQVVIDETESLSGPLNIGVIPTLSPYLIPQFIKEFKTNYPEIQLTISEMNTETLIQALKRESVDMFIAATPLEEEEFFEIPLYYEKFLAYFSKDHPLRDIPLSATNLPQENLWILEEGHCLRDQIFNFCQRSLPYNHTFEAGSIDTLVRIVDMNGGYSVIPELHMDFLREEQQINVREINDPPAIREISIVIKNNFIKEKMINAVADSIKSIIPNHMLDERLKKFSIKLL